MSKYKLMPVEPDETISAVISLVKDAAAAHLNSEFNSCLSKIRKLLAAGTCKAAVQVEPVAAQHRFRHPQMSLPDWSIWQPATISLDRPSWEIDSQGYEVEYRLLYTVQQPTEQQPMQCQECGGDGAGGEHEEDCIMTQVETDVSTLV